MTESSSYGAIVQPAMLLLYMNDSSCRDLYNQINKTDFICENCNHSIVATIKGGAKNYAISAVEREIDRRIRTS